ncbi:aspartyl protease family protein [Sphingomonas sp.]|uniref:aspartyl protease family protein n=1 Tax=Sphingomonas sp. TaxID=28214 RepID=UPI0038AD11A1
MLRKTCERKQASGRRFAVALAPFALLLCAPPVPALAEGLIVFGSSDAGGGTNAYETVIDLASGHQRTTQIHGQSSDERGYDGQLWNYVNGSRNIIDMPSEFADRQAERWINQRAWATFGRPGESTRHVTPPGASAVDLTFDPSTHRVSTATIQSDYGPVIVKFSDWRPVGKYVFPFRQERTGDLDGPGVDVAQSVRLVDRVDPRLLARPAEPILPPLGGAVTVPFKSVGRLKNHTLVSASINGTPAEFIFDTGAANILTIDGAKRFGIASAGGINIGGVGEGTDNGGFGMVDRISIGPATLEDQSFIIIPSPFPPTNGKPSDTAGLLGYEFLAHFVTTIDYRAETMTFRDAVAADQRGVRLPFVSDGHAIAVTASVNGKPVSVRFDTGDGGNLSLFPAYVAASGIDAGTGEIRTNGGGAGGAVKSKAGRVDHFTLAGVDFPNLPAEFSQNSRGAFASRHLAGNLGAGVIRCFRITFDYRHHQLWLEPQLDTPQCAAAPKPSA